MSEPLIPAQTINPVTPSILSIPSSILDTSAQATTNEFNLSTNYFPSLTNSTEKDDTANHDANAALRHAKERNATVQHANEIKFFFET